MQDKHSDALSDFRAVIEALTMGNLDRVEQQRAATRLTRVCVEFRRTARALDELWQNAREEDAISQARRAAMRESANVVPLLRAWRPGAAC